MKRSGIAVRASILCALMLLAGAWASSPALRSGSDAISNNRQYLRPDWASSVGALTPFDAANAIDIADFCSGGADVDSTDCAREWIAAGQNSGAHLYASAGIYRLSKHLPVFDGMHVSCTDPATTVFQKVAGTSYPHFANYDDQLQSDLLIQNCGFDMNGDPRNFANSLKVDNVRHVTYTGNRVFDSTGMRDNARDKQRIYVAIIQAEDVLVSDNQLSEGGRIKAGRPGRRVIIRNNTLDFVNDNGITVVGKTSAGWPDGSNVSEDILIERNTIRDPTVTGIFFGSDGKPNGVGVETYRITIVHNHIEGAISGQCIKGMLPDVASEIYIADNTCVSESTSFPQSQSVGFGLRRSDNAAGDATDVTVQRNDMRPVDRDGFPSGTYFLDSLSVCMIDNVSSNNAIAVWARWNVTGHFSGNDWGGGTVREDSGTTIDQDVDGCFVPYFVEPSAEPSPLPSPVPTPQPSHFPRTAPSAEPGPVPSTAPSAEPGPLPSPVPTAQPNYFPSAAPSAALREENPDTQGWPLCFSPINTVEVKGKGTIPIAQLQIGDLVRGGNHGNKDASFTRVYSHGHLDHESSANYLQIFSEGLKQPLEISPRHLLFVNNEVAQASEVKEGDLLGGGNHKVVKVTSIQRRGMYAPFTESGEIQVSGIDASNYISLSELVPFLEYVPNSVHHALSHSSMAPLRWACSLNFGICEGESYKDGFSTWVYDILRTAFNVRECFTPVKIRASMMVLGPLLLGSPLLVAFFFLGLGWNRKAAFTMHS